MQYALVVVRSFGPHARGDMIRDPDTMRAVLAHENAVRVVRVVPATFSAKEG